MAAYQDILSRAQGVAGTPYTPYTGELTAPVNAQQSTGIANINANWNSAQPYLQTAAGYAQDAATPLTSAQIQQYMSPYTQSVVDATQAQFQNQNQQQLQQNRSQAIAQGALGGNRQGIAEAELAGQQQRSQAPVIAGLYNQSYTTGLNTALSEQQARAQGAYSLGNLGVSGQNAALTGANAQVGAGTLQQSTQQAQDAAAYQQFINQQAYPFQTLQWLAGIGTGVGSQMGGTGSTTAPGPNPMAQWLGLGVAGLGAAGQAGMFGGSGSSTGDSGMYAPSNPNANLPGWNSDGSVANRAEGGVIGDAPPWEESHGWVPTLGITPGKGAPPPPKPPSAQSSSGGIGDIAKMAIKFAPMMLASGGVAPDSPPTNGVGAMMSGLPYGGRGWIPKNEMARGRGAPPPPQAHGVAPMDLAKQAKEIGSLAGLINNPNSGAPSNQNEGWGPSVNEGGGLSASDENPTIYWRGGPVHRASGGVANLPFHLMVPHLAEGGSPYDTDYFDNTFAAPIRHDANSYGTLTTPGAMKDYSDRIIADSDYRPQVSELPMPRRRPEGIAPSYDLPPEITAGYSRASVEGGRTAMGYADDGSVPIGRSRMAPSKVHVVEGDQPSPLDNAAWPQGPVGSPAQDAMARAEPQVEPERPRGVAPTSGIDFSGNSKLWPSLMAAGFGAMASRSPFLGTAVGEGGLAGMQTYSNERQREDRINSEVKKLSQEATLAQKRLDLATRTHDDTVKNQNRPYTEQTADQKAKSKETAEYHQLLGNRMQLRPTGTQTEEGHPIFVDGRTGQSIDSITGEPVAADAKVVSQSAAKAPSGYVRNPDGTMSAVKGGPADPEIIAGLVKAKAGAAMPDATADFLAERVINGDAKALIGLGRGAQGAENIIRIQGIVAQKAAERGLNASDLLAKVAEQSGLTAQQRTFGTQVARMAVNSTEAEGAIHQGLEVSKLVPRTKFVPVNKLVQMAETNISDPDLLEFRAANLAIINTYARAISPTGVPTVHDKEEAMKIVSEATSPEAYERVMRRMLKEIDIAHKAPLKAKAEMEAIRKAGAPPVEPSAVVTAPGSRPTITTKEEFDRLPSGAEYIRNGNAYRKP